MLRVLGTFRIVVPSANSFLLPNVCTFVVAQHLPTRLLRISFVARSRQRGVSIPVMSRSNAFPLHMNLSAMKLLAVTTTTATFYGRCASKSTTKIHAAGNANGYSRELVSEERKKARQMNLIPVSLMRTLLTISTLSRV